MKVRLAQINPIVGNLSYNTKLIKDTILSSSEFDLIVFPELILTGYPPQDLLLNKQFIKKTREHFEDIVQGVKDQVVILGLPRHDHNQLCNSAAIIKAGKVIGFHDKILLPTYDIFDEKRYFGSSNEIKSFNVTIRDENINLGIQICEDLWDDEYDIKVADRLIENGADMIINISASPYRKNIFNKRLKLCANKSINLKYYFIYCNMVGGQDELVFDGRSFILDSSGILQIQGKSFENDFVDFDSDNITTASKNNLIDESEEIFQALSLGVKDYFKKSGFSKAVIGLSGGIDSALTAAIATDALGKENVIGVSMPSKFSSNHSRSDAKELAENLDIEFRSIEIQNIYDKIILEVDSFFADTPRGLAEENLQARIRGNILMAISNKINALVLNTGNKTELALGYCTMYGDMCGALGVISDINKLEVYEISHWINTKFNKNIIPSGSISKPPSAELSENQVDPFDYKQVSPIVDKIINDLFDREDLLKLGYESHLIDDIISRISKSEYKRRQAPPGIKVSKKAFGMGRRYPINNQYKFIDE